ncbi:hypothetical protein LCGC14_1835670 [marine sediment metagenome]|uniref:Uncharacterized protein n=1 Tax=marine sediment metagenome TaxID=412755 RepID=A0A0F9GES9_9ZZZZ
MSDLGQLIRFELNLDLYCKPSEVSRIIRGIEKLTRKKVEGIYFRVKDVEEDLIPMRYMILDLEGYFPILVGILINNKIFQFYITEKKDGMDLYEILFEILRIAKNFYIITFSPWEGNFFKILYHKLLASHSMEELEFLKHLKIIDIQDRYYESLNAGLFKLDEKILPDPLIRISDNVDILFEMKMLDLVAQHNVTCLRSSRIIFKNRYLKLNLI